ncbi:MAG: glycosyltransferase N-terminal domain-containing protein [Algoriphagus sp.]|nr:glycosyltransferase N-terminal domain-containing protein [Algoriphagus sp.]
MNWFYRLGLFVLSVLLPVAEIFIPKIRHFLQGRKSIFQNLIEFRKTNSGPIAWFHVASLGEYEQARPVIAELKKSRPELMVAVSFFSPSGYDNVIKKTQPNVDFITYLPLDRKSLAVRFVETLNPELVFFVKYDLWPQHILALKATGIPVFLVSASFRPDHIYFRSDGFFRKILFQLDYIFTQNQQSIQLLNSIGFEKAEVAGDTRFDRVMATASSPKEFPDIKKWVGNKPAVVVGSAWEEDMQILIPLINSHPDYCWIIAPHDLSPQPMKDWADSISLESSRYSKWNRESTVDVLFIDNIGMLSSLFQFARVAYVGGAFGKGLHNILEPVGFGIPVIFGKLRKSEKFPEAAQSQREGCGFEVENVEALKAVFERLEQEDFYKKSAESAQFWVKSNLGAAEKIIEKVTKLMLRK